ncbi:MAG: RNA-binding transcriptional accessory protein [Bacteroidales bacterium]|jgi:uncharacterized protein|nr:RNA-binding transcriptional accessory protein [Bacteroidales bacterium]
MKIKNYAALIAQELGLKEQQVKNTIDLISSGATIPFIARYRKELTDSLDEVMVSTIKEKYEKWIELDKRRATIIDSIVKQEKMTPELQQQIDNALTIQELEDIYLPYKPKRKTRATVAEEKGLKPLAEILFSQQDIIPKKTAAKYVNPELGVNTIEEALQGAQDIMAEWICEKKVVRERLRLLFTKEATISSKVVKDKEKEGEKYENFFSSSGILSKEPSHRILAMFRGEKEGFLRLNIAPEEKKSLDLVQKYIIRRDNLAANHVKFAITDSYKRLLQPQMETEMYSFYKEKADKEAISVFVINLRQLLLASPLGQKRVLAIDPGFRTGCKVVTLDAQGKLLHNENIYPHPPHTEYKLSSDKLKRLVEQYQIEAIAIGNGTAGRETENFVRKIPFERDLQVFMVNESGASVYSASALAREEFPDYDVTVRGAVSIGRRLMDPLAELVKIDSKSIGVGQYQHDVDQNLLRKSLEETVISCVNHVGVEVNTASKELLSYVSGIGPVLAKNIVEYRNENGVFLSRAALKKVSRFGDKAFEQAAGFLRILNAKNPLDASAVHPESYAIVELMAKKMNCTVTDLMNKDTLRKEINLQNFINEKVGLPTLKDIMTELTKKNRDPREEIDSFEFDNNISNIRDLQAGMVIPGIVTNITNFGCFVDIGVHQDGLVHISNIANQFIKNPNDILKLHQKVMVKVLDVEIDRKRINLSIKDAQE